MGTETQPPPVAVQDDTNDRQVATSAVSSVLRTWKRGPIVALTVLVLFAATAYAGAAQLVSTPRVHPDEHIYALAGAALAAGEGLTLRGEDYGLGPVYPAVLATVLTVTPDRETAYHLFKVANALLFALASIPIFLVARRLLSPWWSVGVAAMSLAIPSSLYVSLVMTESAAYLTYSIALYAIVLALERPSTVRQLAAIAAVALAYGTRAQLAVLLIAYLGALGVVWAMSRERARLRETLVRLWPSLAAVALGAVVFLVRPLLTGSSPADAVGVYSVLFRGYDPLDIGKWVAYLLADLEIYLAIVPLAVSPIVISRLWRRGRSGFSPASAFVAAFLTVNGGMLFVTAAFSSTEFGFDRLHDRNIFYLAPLWLIVLAIWLADGLPRARIATGVGIALALALPLVLPFRYIAGDVGVDVVPSALWARLNELLAGEIVTARKLLAILLVVLLVAVVALPRRFGWVFPAVLLASFALTAVLAWNRMIDARENAVFEGAGSETRSWIDDRLPANARVTKLYLDNDLCPSSAVTRHALYLTEFFNAKVHRAAYIDDSIPDGLPIERVDVGAGGRLVNLAGEPLVADYVYTQPGIELDGTKVGSGTAANLVLWQVGGPVKIVGASSNDDVTTDGCA